MTRPILPGSTLRGTMRPASPIRPAEASISRQKQQGSAMTKKSEVRSVELLACDAGWRNYHFVKLTTEDGVVGWSEFDEGFGSPGVDAAIQRLSAPLGGTAALPP